MEKEKSIIDLSHQNAYSSRDLIEAIKDVRKMLLGLAAMDEKGIYSAAELSQNLDVLDWLTDDVQYLEDKHETLQLPPEGETSFIYWGDSSNNDERIFNCRNIADNVWRLQGGDTGVKIALEKSRRTGAYE